MYPTYPRDIKSSFKSRLLLGLLLLQAAAVGLLTSDLYGDSFSMNQVKALIRGEGVAQGTRMPAFTAYDQNRKRANALAGAPTVIVFFGCECQADQLRNEVEPTGRGGENVVFVVQTRPDKLATLQRKHALFGKVLAIRASDLFSTLGLQKIPVIVRLSSDGTVISIEQK